MVRKIRASIAGGEQLEKPITTPCSAIAETGAGLESREKSPSAALMSGPEDNVSGPAGPRASSERAVQQCGS